MYSTSIYSIDELTIFDIGIPMNNVIKNGLSKYLMVYIPFNQILNNLINKGIDEVQHGYGQGIQYDVF